MTNLREDILDDLNSILSDWDDVIWGTTTYKGIFHNAYEAALLFTGEIESKNPFVEVMEADFSAITHTSTVTINAVVYHITAIEPDGTGMMILRLSKD
jgi:hypothetical protein